MARIRTIKPEFPQSESMGNVSRESRLCFILMWTLADDSGRLRASSRLLASLLFPYDEDAQDKIDGWLVELNGEGCITLYEADGNHYAQINNWLTHQKIDRPSESKIQAPTKEQRTLATIREASCLDQGPKDQGPGGERSPKREPPGRGTRLSADWKPDEEDRSFAKQLGLDPDRVAPPYRDYWIAKPGAAGVKLDWKATWRNWCRKESEMGKGGNSPRASSGGLAKIGSVTVANTADFAEQYRRKYAGMWAPDGKFYPPLDQQKAAQ